MKQIPDSVWNRPISGLNLTNDTFSAELGDDKTLLVFLRHFG